VTANVGQTASFTAAASGTPTPTVQWQVSTDGGSTWNDIAGATQTTFSFTVAASQDGNKYRAVFTNSAGSATSYSGTLSLSSATAGPSITTQPTNQTVPAGQGATFTAAASGSPTPTVQWQVSTDGGATWNNIAGATQATLNVPPASAQNGNQYRAVFSNNILVNGDFEGSTFTDAATGDVLPNGFSLGPPSPASLSKANVDTAVDTATFLGPQSGTHFMRFQSPANNGTRDCLYQDINTVAGQTYTVSFWVAITSTSVGNNLGLDPVWDENGANSQTLGNAFYLTPSNTGPVNYQFFSFTATASSNKTRLDFHGIDANGSILLDNIQVVATATTNAATLTVSNAPSITTQPSSQTVTAGQTASFTAAASGTPTPTVQWQLSTNGGATWNNIAGATATTFSITNTTASQSGAEYRAVFTNSAGSATSNAATLTVTVAPSITTQPTNQTVTAGQTATFTAAATGSPTPTVQWQVSTNGGSAWSNISGATATTFSVTNAATSQSGAKYRAVFTNGAGSATSNAATLTVNTPSGTTTATFRQGVAGYTGGQDAGITTQYAIYNGGNGVQYLNQPTLEIGTDGQGSVFESLIKFNSLNIPSNAVVSGASLTLTIVDWWGNTSVTGYYVKNAWSIADKTIGFIHRGNGLDWATPGALGQGTDLVAGKSFTLPTTNANGPQTFTINLDPAVVQNWIANPTADQGILLVTSAPRTVGVDTAENSTVSVRPLLKVTYSTGAATAPSVITQPTNQTVTAGQTATFTAAATGSPTPTVQWQLSTNGGSTWNNIGGATATTLSITNTTTSQSGAKYRAVFTNGAGSATTNAATLTVNAAAIAPSITTQPTNQTVTAGQTATFTAGATGSPTPTVQWQVSTNGGSTWGNISGATATTLSFATTTAQNGNQYRAVFTNSAGSATTTAATLTVNSPLAAPTIVTNPSNQTVAVGSTANFAAAASGNPTPTVQWQVSTGGAFTDIPGATSTTYSFIAVASQNGNQYRAVFTNSVGTATTTAATLTTTKGIIVGNGQTLEVNAGQTVNGVTVLPGGYLLVHAGGTDNGSFILGGVETVEAGGQAIGTTVDATGTTDGDLEIFGTGTNLILNNGYINVDQGGVINNTTINGDIIYVSGGGVANNTTIKAGGSMTVIGGGIANGTVLNGGTEWVRAGAVSNNPIVNNGGIENTLGGVVNNLTLNAGGSAGIDGTVNGATINGGAELDIVDGGAATGAIVDNGAFVFNISTTITFGGQLTGNGAMAVNGTGKLVVSTALNNNVAVSIGNSSTLELMAAANSNITFGYESTLKLDASLSFTGTLAATPGYLDVIDLGDIPYLAGVTSVQFVENAAHTEGTLTVSDQAGGGPTVQLTLLGDFSIGTFTTSADSANPNPGTLVKGPF
jgi:autotransporter passenger strand-loop-strand repeat protein